MNCIYLIIQGMLIVFYGFEFYKAKKSDKPKEYKYGHLILLSFTLPMVIFWLHSMMIELNQVYDGKLRPVEFGSEENNYKVVVYPFVQYDFFTLKKIKIDDSKIGGTIVVKKYIPTDIKMYTSSNNFYYKKDLVEKTYLCSHFNLNFKKCVEFMKSKRLN